VVPEAAAGSRASPFNPAVVVSVNIFDGLIGYDTS